MFSRETVTHVRSLTSVEVKRTLYVWTFNDQSDDYTVSFLSARYTGVARSRTHCSVTVTIVVTLMRGGKSCSNIFLHCGEEKKNSPRDYRIRISAAVTSIRFTQGDVDGVRVRECSTVQQGQLETLVKVWLSLWHAFCNDDVDVVVIEHRRTRPPLRAVYVHTKRNAVPHFFRGLPSAPAIVDGPPSNSATRRDRNCTNIQDRNSERTLQRSLVSFSKFMIPYFRLRTTSQKTSKR